MTDVSQYLGAARREDRSAGFRSQHEQLRASGKALEVLLGRLAEGEADETQVSRVKVLLDDFRRRLLDHFSAEERAGLLEHAGDYEPRFARLVERLRREHGEFRVDIDRLVEEAPGAAWTQLYAEFVEFRRLLHEHEKAEDEVMQRAYLEDTGGRG